MRCVSSPSRRCNQAVIFGVFAVLTHEKILRDCVFPGGMALDQSQQLAKA